MRSPLRCIVLAASVAAFAGWGRPAAADPPQAVVVTNFPETQQISGKVVVSEPIPQTRLETKKALVSPAEIADTNHLTDAGTIDAAGFTHVTLSLSASLQGSAQAGTIGVVLLPDVPEVATALRTYGALQFGLRVDAPLSSPPASLFSSESVTFRLAFPRYRVLLYNSTQKAADATVFLYLSSS
jgi:hypothetical protein